jgi:hypothetical protein
MWTRRRTFWRKPTHAPVTYSLMFADKVTAVWIGSAANRTGVNVTETASTNAHALLRYGRIRKCEPGFRVLNSVFHFRASFYGPGFRRFFK